MTPWDLPEKFRSRIRVDESGCWHYMGPRTQWGYGIVSIAGHGRAAHRAAYEILVGPIPSGYQIDHLCRVPRCCNPQHLEAVTPQENRRRSPTSPENRTNCPAGHAYSEDNTYRYADGRRACRACLRNHKRAFAQRRKQPA